MRADDMADTKGFLTYEEELALSDALVRRREIRDSLDSRGFRQSDDKDKAAAERLFGATYRDRAFELLTEEEQRDWLEGDKAASELVAAYTPLLYTIANGVRSRRLHNKGNFISIEELVSEGAADMLLRTWSFNARGTDKHPGRRFASYVRLSVTKAMNRHVLRMSTSMKTDLSIVDKTWVWIATRNELRYELNRWPTDEEVFDRCGIDPDIVHSNIPSVSTMLDVDDVEVRARGSVEEQVISTIGVQNWNGVLETVLSELFIDEYVETTMLLMGIDQGIPRQAEEVGKILGKPASAIVWREHAIYAALRHPQNRIEMRNILREMRDAGALPKRTSEVDL